MSNKFRRVSVKKPKQKMNVPGTSPGTLQVAEGALQSKIVVYSFSEKFFQEKAATGFQEVREILKSFPTETHWVEIRGLGDIKLLADIQENFGISKLVMEDILHTHQRPKIEEFDKYVFATSRMLCLDKNLQLENEQLSFLVFANVLFTFEENYEDCLEAVRKRLREGKGNIRISGPSYLMYANMDMILDNYFYLINKFGEELDSLEERVHRRPDKSILFEVQQIKRALIIVRRASWPERDKINDMLRSDSPLISQNTKFFLKDVYDHSMQIIDLVESYKEITTSLIDMYLSFVSNRTNEIMKVLTVISSIFIPLTFIVGVYGMNFARQDPETGKILHKNMPELYSENGYVYVMTVMGIIALIQLIYFWRKGWLR